MIVPGSIIPADPRDLALFANVYPTAVPAVSTSIAILVSRLWVGLVEQSQKRDQEQRLLRVKYFVRRYIRGICTFVPSTER
jgi:hypothetical protein